MSGAFPIGTASVGGGARCFVIAEAGVNHNGDIALAHRLVDAAAESMADAVKFQTFDPEKLVSPDAPKAEYQARQTGSTETQFEMLKKLVLSREAHAELKAHAEKRGMIFMSTPFDEGAADFLVALGVPALKVPSGELTNHPFLAHLARKNLPVLMSTGMADLVEVEAAIAAIRAAGTPPIALFHCTSSYPAPPESINLRAMDTMRRHFDVPVGYSDHSLGDTVPLAAVAMGAELLEKHLTLDRTMPGPDHAASMEPHAFAEMIAAIRALEPTLGDGVKRPHPCEIDTRGVARRSLFAARDLARGARLTADDLVSRRPGTGISPARLEALTGRTILQPVERGAMISEADLD